MEKATSSHHGFVQFPIRKTQMPRMFFDQGRMQACTTQSLNNQAFDSLEIHTTIKPPNGHTGHGSNLLQRDSRTFGRMARVWNGFVQVRRKRTEPNNDGGVMSKARLQRDPCDRLQIYVIDRVIRPLWKEVYMRPPTLPDKAANLSNSRNVP